MKEGLGGSEALPPNTSSHLDEDGVNNIKDLHAGIMSPTMFVEEQCTDDVRVDKVGVEDVISSLELWDTNFYENVRL